MKSLRKTISVLLAILMVCSAFSVMTLTASAKDVQKVKTAAENVAADTETATDDEAQNYDYKNYEYEVKCEGTVAVSTNRVFKYIKFVTDVNESYEISSDANDDTYGVLLDEFGEAIDSDDDSGEENNFKINIFLNAGKTYYLAVRTYNSLNFIDYNVSFKKSSDTPAGWKYEGKTVTIGDFTYSLYFDIDMSEKGEYSKCYGAKVIGYNGSSETVVIPESFEYDDKTVYVREIGNYFLALNSNADKIKKVVASDTVNLVEAYALFDSEGGKRLDITLECSKDTELQNYYAKENDLGFYINVKSAAVEDYYGSNADIVIPAMVQGVPVVSVNNFIDNELKPKIKTITVPDTVEYISGYVFCIEYYDENTDTYYSKKSDIKVIGGENAEYGSYSYTDEKGFEFDVEDNSATLLKYIGNLSDVVIPSTTEGVPVENISAEILINDVTSVTIPDSVKTIDYYAFYIYGFDDGYYKSNAVIKGGENAFIYGYYETDENGIRYYINRYKTVDVASYYGSNPTLTIPDSYKGFPVTSVNDLESGDNDAFIKNAIVPATVKNISDIAFRNFSNLESVTIPCSLANTYFYVWNRDLQKNIKMENVIKAHTIVTDQAVAPTTTKTGLTEGSHCSVCGKVITAQQVVPKLTKISLAKSSAKVYVKGTTQIKATVRNGKGKTTYKSSNPKVAKVSKTGKVTGLKKGTATITVKNNKVIKKFTVKVKNPKLSKKSVSIKNGKTTKVKIIGKIKGVKNKYTNAKIAKVTSKKSASTLKIKGLKKGNTTLKIKVSGITLKLKVKVK